MGTIIAERIKEEKKTDDVDEAMEIEEQMKLIMVDRQEN